MSNTAWCNQSDDVRKDAGGGGGGQQFLVRRQLVETGCLCSEALVLSAV